MDNRGTGKAGGSCQCDWSRWGHGTLDYTDRSSGNCLLVNFPVDSFVEPEGHHFGIQPGAVKPTQRLPSSLWVA